MAADQERADRIRALKKARPDLTWRRIADYVGVTERSATDWQTKGGMEYANAKKLAELFEVDVDYVWRGGETAPNPFAGRDVIADQLDRIERELGEIRQQREGFLKLLAEQTKLLELIGELVGGDALATRADEAVKASIERTRGDLAKLLARASGQAVRGR